MENGNHDSEDDIFESNINELDVRETPRWEMSEEEPDMENEPTLLNHVAVNNQGKQIPNSVEGPGFGGSVVPRSSSGPGTNTSSTLTPGGNASGGMSPYTNRIADAQCLPANHSPRPVHKNGIDMSSNKGTNKSQEMIDNGSKWDDDCEEDSVKDFGGHDRELEAKYMERTDEAIYYRAAEEHIRQPDPYEDDDEVKNFGGGSQRISRLPSEEHICLSPPWIEEDDGAVVEESEGVIVEETQKSDPAEATNYNIDEIIARVKIRADFPGSHHWQIEETLDFTKNFAAEGSIENSRRPSSEDLSLTPPWIDNDNDSCKEYENERVGNVEPTSDGPHVPGSSAAFPELTGAASGQSAGEHLPGPGLLSPNTDIPLAQKNRLAEELRPEPKSPNISARAKSSSVDQSNSGISFTGNPQMPSTRPHRRITPPEQSADYYNVRKVTPPSASLKCSQQPAYDDQYHKPTPPTSFPSNNLYGPRTQSSRSSNPLLTVNRPNAPTQTFRPSNPDPKGYYGMPVNPAQFAPNAVTVRPNRAPNRTPPVLSDPSYSQNPRTLPTQGSAAYGGGIPRASLGDTPRMMSPRQARNRYEATYYNQPGKWPYQMMPGNHPKKLPDNPPVFPTGFVPPPRMATAHYAAYPSRANLSPHGQRSILPSDMRHYSDLPDGNLIPEDDSSPVMSTRCVSQSSIAAHCCTPHPDGLETASVMSFASGASTHQDLDSKVDQLRNLLSVIDSQDAKEIAQTLFSLSNSKENCQAMRQSGCIPLLVKLQHKEKSKDSRVGHYIRMRAAHTMRNIITAGAEDRRGRRELRVLRLLEIVRGYCVEMRFRKISNKEKNVEQALAAIMKLSFEEEHRAALGELGGVEAIGEFLQVRYATKVQDSDSPGSSLLKYASMTLTNMTFGNTRNKALLGNSPGIVKAFLGHLKVINDEDLIQVSASVLRNLSCKADERSKTVFQECNAVAALMTAAQKVSDESALRTILYAVWNLSAHSSENKTQICETPGALAFLVKMLVYKNVNNSLSVVESSGGILRNLSSHVAVKPEYRTILREHECFQKLLVHLRSPSLRVVSNACGTLWNLSARCQEDQELLWKLGAVSLLKPLVSSKNKSIAKGAGAAIKNLHNYKSSTAMSPSQSQNLSSNSRKQNGVGPNTGSPSQTRAKENRLGRSCSRSRDIQSLDSITGSTDDMAKESGRRTVKLNNKSISGQRNGDAEPTSDRVKGVRWVDDRTSGKRAGKDPIRKVTGNEIKRAEGSPDEQQLFTSGGDSRVPASKDLGAREDISNLTTAVAQTSLGEKNRGSRKSDRLYSPKTKKKSSWKNKKHAPEPGNTDINLLISLQDPEPHKPTNASTTKQGSANLRRKVYSDSQRLDGTEKASSRCGGKQISVKTEEDNLGREEHENRGDTVMDHSEETEVPQSETSEEDGLRSSATSGKSNVKNARVKTMDDNSEETALVLSKKMGNLSIQRCQCPEETEVWIKRTKRCDRCQRRRVSHSSESTSGSGRSSYESLSSSNRQLNRKELGTNGPGYVTTI